MFTQYSSPVPCHVSCVMCHLSLVTCHLSLFFFFSFFFLFFYKLLKLVGGGSDINGAYPIRYLSCFVAKKAKFPNHNFSIKTTNTLVAFPFPLSSTIYSHNILLLKFCKLLPQSYLLEVHLPDPDSS